MKHPELDATYITRIITTIRSGLEVAKDQQELKRYYSKYLYHWQHKHDDPEFPCTHGTKTMKYHKLVGAIPKLIDITLNHTIRYVQR